MKILFGGDFRYEWYQAAAADALEAQGHQVVRFPWLGAGRASVLDRVQIRVMNGPLFRRVDAALQDAAARERPDLIFLWTCWPVSAETLRQIRSETRAVLASYTNDDPFSPHANRRFWSRFIQNIPHFDLHFVFRHRNLLDFSRAGAREVALLRGYYVPALHRAVELSVDERERFESDAIFVGHFTEDGRVACLRALVDAGLRIRVFGARWPARVIAGLGLDPASNGYPITGRSYAAAVQAARTSLCFLSRLNRDTYTTRTFEIPASGGLLVAEHTPEQASLFEPGREALFFTSAEELVDAVRWCVNSPAEADEIRQAGRRRCMADGHDVASRMREMVATVEWLRRTPGTSWNSSSTCCVARDCTA